MVAMNDPRAYWATYWSIKAPAFRISSLSLVKFIDLMATKWRFLHCFSLVRCMILDSCLIQPLLNLINMLPNFSLWLANHFASCSCFSSLIATSYLLGTESHRSDHSLSWIHYDRCRCTVDRFYRWTMSFGVSCGDDDHRCWTNSSPL